MTETTTSKNPTPEEVEKILANTDWDDFWKKVAEKAEPEIEAYRKASARSMGGYV
jgi:hypothetical protein